MRPSRALREVADGVGIEDADGGGEGAARGGGFHRVQGADYGCQIRVVVVVEEERAEVDEEVGGEGF